MKKKYWIIVASAVLLVVTVIIIANMCKNTGINADNSEDKKTEQENNEVMEYKSITMEEAKDIFAKGGDYIILDVRRADEYAEGHIPGSINVANESIGSDMPKELPDKNQVIYVYCRSGRRSKEASSKLAAMGYTNIIEFGGIIDWTGEVEK